MTDRFQQYNSMLISSILYLITSTNCQYITETYSIRSMALNQMSIYEIFSTGTFPAGVHPCYAIQLLPAVLTARGWALTGEGDIDKPSWRDYKPISYLLLGLALMY